MWTKNYSYTDQITTFDKIYTGMEIIKVLFIFWKVKKKDNASIF